MSLPIDTGTVKSGAVGPESILGYEFQDVTAHEYEMAIGPRREDL